MRLIWSRASLADLSRIDTYLFERDPEFAARSAEAALAAGLFLVARPHAGSPVAGTRRKWPVRGSPYLLNYRVTADAVEILRVRHEREDWRSLP